MGETRFLTNREIYEQAVLKLVPSAKKRLWIATADIKDMYVEKPGLSKQMVPFLQILAELLERPLMGRFQPFIEQGHDRNRLLCRALKVIEPDRIFDVPGGQFLPGNRIDILLERGENGLGNVLP